MNYIDKKYNIIAAKIYIKKYIYKAFAQNLY
jgi:hypothetical protein